MAYRNPAFALRHFGAEAGAAKIFPSSTATGFVKDRLIDYRHGANFKFASATTDQYVRFEFDAITIPDPNRLIIPAGHNLSGATVRVDSGATMGLGTVRASFVAGSGLIDQTFTTSAHRFYGVVVETSGQWEFPEIWFTRYEQTVTGPRPAWQFPLYTPAVIRSYSTREAVLVSSTSRRRLVMEHQGISGADLTLYADLLGRGVRTPFWFYPPDDDALFTSPALMRLTDDGDLEQDHPVPTVGRSYTVKIRALEQTT